MKLYSKIIALAAAGIFCAINLSAQVGVEAGYLNSSYSSKLKGSSDKATKSEPMNGFYVGVTDDVKLVAGLSIQPGLYYSYLNSNENEETLGFKFSTGYTEHALNVPVHVKYTFGILPVLKVYVFAGPTFSLGLAAETKSSVTGELLGEKIDGSVKYDSYTGKISSQNLSESMQNTVNKYLPQSQMSRFDILMGGGVGVDLIKFLTVKGGFDYGLMNRYKGDIAETNTMNRMQFYVSLGIRF